ncbi:MAG: GNAT family N-acetyltransferase [Pseudomonadota bacterium]
MVQRFAAEGFELRLIVPDDARAIAALHADSFHRGWSVDEVQGLLKGAGSIGVIAFVAAEAAGFLFARVIAPDAEIISLAVKHDFRRRGIGGSMLVALEGELIARCCDKIFLEVAETNYDALRLYERLDFNRVGKRPGYYQSPQGCRTTALLLRKNCNLN